MFYFSRPTEPCIYDFTVNFCSVTKTESCIKSATETFSSPVVKPLLQATNRAMRRHPHKESKDRNAKLRVKKESK